MILPAFNLSDEDVFDMLVATGQSFDAQIYDADDDDDGYDENPITTKLVLVWWRDGSIKFFRPFKSIPGGWDIWRPLAYFDLDQMINTMVLR
jgi:hypothetical protein